MIGRVGDEGSGVGEGEMLGEIKMCCSHRNGWGLVIKSERMRAKRCCSSRACSVDSAHERGHWKISSQDQACKRVE